MRLILDWRVLGFRWEEILGSDLTSLILSNMTLAFSVIPSGFSMFRGSGEAVVGVISRDVGSGGLSQWKFSSVPPNSPAPWSEPCASGPPH